ncbi:DUF2878 domain-containing protein [Pseudoalteromonas sp. ZZD1]|uniref:DUF2878 domain-containing protein n=1 Tax=Pseudoalteromonas sp. ZZD1 TaxID=3139395 RepID=UPI003BABA1A2
MALLFENSAVIPVLCIIGLMLYLSRQIKRDSLILVIGLMIALLFEYMMVKLELIGFNTHPYPLWFVLLWSALLLTINTSMQFIARLPWYSAIAVCALFAPMSYWAGARFEVITIAEPLWFFWLVYGLAWAAMFNFIIFVNNKVALYVAPAKPHNN